MDVLGITMFRKFKLNPFDLGSFGGAHSGDFMLVIRRMIVYGVLFKPP